MDGESTGDNFNIDRELCVDYTADEEDDDPFQSEVPIALTKEHIMLLLWRKGKYKRMDDNMSSLTGGSDRSNSSRIRLDVTLSISHVENINALAQSFKCNIRIFAFWKVDLRALGMSDVVDKIHQSDANFALLSKDELETLHRRTFMPIFNIMNSTKMIPLQREDVRVYVDNITNRTALLWNRPYSIHCRNSFNFRDFPFDVQGLRLELRLNDPKLYDHFEMIVSNVQFHLQAIKHTEWMFREPIVSKGANDGSQHMRADITLQLERKSQFYLQNIVQISNLLMLVDLLSFQTEVGKAGDRMILIYTIILIASAFKLFYSSFLPTISYMTVLDEYILYSFATLAAHTFLLVLPSLFIDDHMVAVIINYVCFALAGFLIFANGFHLHYRHFQVKHRQSKSMTKKITVDAKQEWYLFRYSMPHYLDKFDVPPGITRKSNRKSPLEIVKN